MEHGIPAASARPMRSTYNSIRYCGPDYPLFRMFWPTIMRVTRKAPKARCEKDRGGGCEFWEQGYSQELHDREAFYPLSGDKILRDHGNTAEWGKAGRFQESVMRSELVGPTVRLAWPPIGKVASGLV